MTDVLIFGQAHWGRHIAAALNSRTAGFRASVVQPRAYPSLLLAPPRHRRVALMRVGYRIGATTIRGRIFDAYWSMLRARLPSAVRCHYWIGTDVLNTLDEARAGTLRWSAVASSKDDLHLADAPWLATELGSIGIEATAAPVPLPGRTSGAVPPLPATFSVLTYAPAARFAFYGGPLVVEAARRRSEIRFDVVGSESTVDPSAPPNVTWHGWVSDMKPRYAAATVVARVPVHDGLGSTVVEALLNARHVIYNQPLQHVRTISPTTTDTLVDAIDEFHEAHRKGRLGPNLAGREWALSEFDDEKLADDLASLLLGRA